MKRSWSTTAGTRRGPIRPTATWRCGCLQIGIVQFYDAEGNMLLTVNLLEELEPQRMAA